MPDLNWFVRWLCALLPVYLVHERRPWRTCGWQLWIGGRMWLLVVRNEES